MSGFIGVQSDPVLTRVLCARSYLESFPSTHERSDSVSRDNYELFSPPDSMDIEITSPTHPQPQFGISSQMEEPEKPQTQSEVKEKRPSERPVRRRGRPRLVTTKDNAAIEVTIVYQHKAYQN